MSSPKCIQLFAIQTNSHIYQFSENIKIKGDEDTLQCYIKEELKWQELVDDKIVEDRLKFSI